MTITRIPGGSWFPPPTLLLNTTSTPLSLGDNCLLDADEEEVQFIGRVSLAAGTGSKTFGTSGSAIGWFAGASNTFQATATLRVGIKKTLDNANGPPGRATIGAAAFDVYDDLVGGTDTISNTTWRTDAMTAGTPFTLTHGDLVAVCFHLDITANAQSVKVRTLNSQSTFAGSMPGTTLVTSGPTYSAQSVVANLILTFDDGTLGWIDMSQPCTAVSSEAIGNTNWYGNIFRPWAPITVDAVWAFINIDGTTNFDIGIVQDPLGTPAFMSGGSISVDPQNLCRPAAFNGALLLPLPSELTLTAGTDYAVAVKQNSATALTVSHFSVDATSHLQPHGLDATCYAAKSTAGAAFAAQNSGKRRTWMSFRVSGTDAGGGSSNIIQARRMPGAY